MVASSSTSLVFLVAQRELSCMAEGCSQRTLIDSIKSPSSSRKLVGRRSRVASGFGFFFKQPGRSFKMGPCKRDKSWKIKCELSDILRIVSLPLSGAQLPFMAT